MRRKILLVEDDRDTQVIAAYYLQREYDVRVASGPEEALELAVSEIPDLVLLDVGLGGRPAGLDLARTLSADPRFAGTRLVAFTVHDELRARLLEAGCHGLVVKPIHPAELMRRVREEMAAAVGDAAE